MQYKANESPAFYQQHPQHPCYPVRKQAGYPGASTEYWPKNSRTRSPRYLPRYGRTGRRRNEIEKKSAHLCLRNQRFSQVPGC